MAAAATKPPRKPDPLTPNMLAVLKGLKKGKAPATGGATTAADGARQGGAKYTLKMLARRGLVRLDKAGKPSLTGAGAKAIA